MCIIPYVISYSCILLGYIRYVDEKWISPAASVPCHSFESFTTMGLGTWRRLTKMTWPKRGLQQQLAVCQNQ